MLWLLLVSFLWAFSFGLIKTGLAGVDPGFLSVARLGLAFLALLPFLRIKRLGFTGAVGWLLLGAVQFGCMYLFLFHAFGYARGYEVALFTAFTPLYVALLCDLVERRLRWPYFIAAFLALVGVAIIRYAPGEDLSWGMGFLLVQCSNLSFAFGQVFYRYWLRHHAQWRDADGFALALLGGVAVAAIYYFFTAETIWPSLSGNQIMILLYLGLIASGLGFYAWNRGAREVGSSGTLAVMNNGYIPLAIIVSLTLFGEDGEWGRIFLGAGVILAAVVLSERYYRKPPRPRSPG